MRFFASLALVLCIAACNADGLPATDSDGGLPPADMTPPPTRPLDFSVPPSCTRTSDRIDIVAKTWDNRSYGCFPAQAPAGDYQGVITQVDATSFATDSCPPNADCFAPMTSTWQVTAPGLPALSSFLARGGFVRVHVESALTPGGCDATLVVAELPSWGGVDDPVGPRDGRTYVVLHDGGEGNPVAALLDVVPVPLHCGLGGQGCGGGPPDDYALDFAFAQGGATPIVRVLMGQTGVLARGGERYLLRNERSYVSGACDDYSTWSWWALRQ